MNDEFTKEIAVRYKDKILHPFDSLFEEMGYETVSALSDLYSGSTLYIPTKKRIFAKCFGEEIKKEFNGQNVYELARKYGFCERTIRYIISGHRTWNTGS